MAYVVTFKGYRPPPRQDAIPWTKIQIAESADESGTFTLLETLTISPVDPDPSSPATQTFTTELATMAKGWYKITWEDASGDLSPTPAIFHNSEDDPYFPSIDQIGQLLRARTKDTNGNELGTFTDETRPTGTHVYELIEQAARTVQSHCGVTLDDSVYGMARHVIALRTAMLIELSFFPEQVRAEKSAYAEYKDEYEASQKALCQAAKEAAAGGEPGAADDPQNPSFHFPEDKGGLVGWQTDL